MTDQSPSALLAESAISFLPFEPLATQRELIGLLSKFALESGDRDVFVLNGYAGTGKTSVVGALIKALDAARRKVVVLAPTGRAAKVASSFSAHPASTIHRRIYRPVTSDSSVKSWYIAKNESVDTLFIVDEASLIPDNLSDPSRSLLFQLIRYVYSAPGCRMLLLGDIAQLPPVGQTFSAAMDFDRLRRLGLNPVGFSLSVPVRQTSGSGIVHNATVVRSYLDVQHPDDIPTLDISGYHDIVPISSADLADALSDSYAAVGMEETLIITRSNKRANNFNAAVRNMVMFAEEPIERGERLVISKNDYFWAPRNKAGHLIANGDIAEVTWVGKTEKYYGRFFTEVELRLSDDKIVTANVMLRSLVCEGASLPAQEMERFYNRVLASYEGEISEQMAGALSDPYYNALQAKYAYCVTCHKAQGGQWKHVYVDLGAISPDSYGEDFYRWLYTAMTRATEKVFLINPNLHLR